MNSDTFLTLSTSYPSSHPFALPAAGFTIGTTTRTAATLVNGNVAVLSVPQQTDIRGSSAPIDPNVNNALTADQFGRAGVYRNQGRPYFNSSSLDNGRPFRLRMDGILNVGATQTAKTVNLVIYNGTSATLGSDTALYTSTQGSSTLGSSGVGVATGHYNFIVEVCMIWDSTSQNLVTTEAWSCVAGNYIARAFGSTVASIAGVSSLNFLPAYEFGLANAANNVVFTEFSIEQA